MLISREFVLFKHLGAQDKISFLQKTWFYFFFWWYNLENGPTYQPSLTTNEGLCNRAITPITFANFISFCCFISLSRLIHASGQCKAILKNA